jgi:hypothetical protein
MTFRIVSLFNPLGQKKYYIQRGYKLIFFRIWINVRNNKFPYLNKLSFQSRSEAKEFISKFGILSDFDVS